MGAKRTICPKCYHEQDYNDECVKCGVVISKFLEISKLSESERVDRFNQNLYIEYTSGQGKKSIVPPEIIRWNWGAFFLNFIWSIGNKTWIGLLTPVPFIGYIIPFILGFKGNEWAWKNSKWESIEHFKSVQKKWAIWGACIVIPIVVGFYSLFYMAFQTGEPETGQHLASVDWLPASATDISYTRRYGFGSELSYDCFIPEKDFLALADEEGWPLKEEESHYFYEKRYLNNGGVTVYYDKIAKRLSFWRAHN